jgi:hypothetical protein
MEKKPHFLESIDKKQFVEAGKILKNHIKAAEYVDPRDDYTYGPEMDLLAYAILEEEGPEAFARFHEDFLRFFMEELEPIWGHLHKGHFYMRQGLAYLAIDVSKAYEYFNHGYQEDRLICRDFYDAGQVADGEIRARLSPNYVSLLIIERSKPEYFASSDDRQAYFTGLSRLRMEVFWERHDVELYPIIAAIKKLTPNSEEENLLQAHKEISNNAALDHTFALPPLVSAFLKNLLLNKLYHERNVRNFREKSIRQAGLLDLVDLAESEHIFPNNSLCAFCQMVSILEKELSLKVEDEYSHEIDPVTEKRIGYGLKSLLEKALVDWSIYI